MNLIKNFDCSKCIKKIVCKYKENIIPQAIQNIENKLNNQVYDDGNIITVSVSCKEFELEPYTGIKYFDK